VKRLQIAHALVQKLALIVDQFGSDLAQCFPTLAHTVDKEARLRHVLFDVGAIFRAEVGGHTVHIGAERTVAAIDAQIEADRLDHLHLEGAGLGASDDDVGLEGPRLGGGGV